MDYCKNLDPKTFNNTQDYMLELVRQGLQAGYDLEDIAEHYKEKNPRRSSRHYEKHTTQRTQGTNPKRFA